MLAKIQKWGNSQGLRISRELLNKQQFDEEGKAPNAGIAMAGRRWYLEFGRPDCLAEDMKI